MTRLRLEQLESNGSTTVSGIDIPRVQVKTEGGRLYYKIDTDGDWQKYALSVFLFVQNRHRKENRNIRKFSHPRHYSAVERKGVEYSTGAEKTRLYLFGTTKPAVALERTTEFPVGTLKQWYLADIPVEKFFKTGKASSNMYDMTCSEKDFDMSQFLRPIAINSSSAHRRTQIECRLAVAINNPDDSSWKRILIGPKSESFYLRFESTSKFQYHKTVSMNRRTTFIK